MSTYQDRTTKRLKKKSNSNRHNIMSEKTIKFIPKLSSVHSSFSQCNRKLKCLNRSTEFNTGPIEVLIMSSFTPDQAHVFERVYLLKKKCITLEEQIILSILQGLLQGIYILCCYHISCLYVYLQLVSTGKCGIERENEDIRVYILLNWYVMFVTAMPCFK